MRLNQYLASCGIASRRKCDELIRSGRVSVNGRTDGLLGVRVEPGTDDVAVDGIPARLPEENIYILLNKPCGCVCTCADDKGRKTVLDIVRDVRARLFPVGRLDYDTEGLLILTNDGALAHRLTHPRHEVEKRYVARVGGRPEPDALQKLREGILLDGRRTHPARVEVLLQKDGVTQVGITIHEGRNRQVRRMMEAVGLRMLALERTHVGSLSLGSLKTGEYRRLTEKETEYLLTL